MPIEIDEMCCTGCGDCEYECPVGAINVVDVATVDNELCIDCGECIDVCPEECIEWAKE